MADPKKAPRRPAAGALQSDPPTRFAVPPTRFAPTGPQPVPPASEPLPSYGGGPPVVTGGYSPPDQETSPLANIGTPSIPPGYELARPEDQGPSSLSKILSIIGELTKGAATGSQYPDFLSAMGGSYGARQDELSQQAQLQRQQRMEDESAEQDRLKSEQDRLKSEADIDKIRTGNIQTEAATAQTQLETDQARQSFQFTQDELRAKIDERRAAQILSEVRERNAGRKLDLDINVSEARMETLLAQKDQAEAQARLADEKVKAGEPRAKANLDSANAMRAAAQGSYYAAQAATEEKRAETDRMQAEARMIEAGVKAEGRMTAPTVTLAIQRIQKAVTDAIEVYKFLPRATAAPLEAAATARVLEANAVVLRMIDEFERTSSGAVSRSGGSRPSRGRLMTDTGGPPLPAAPSAGNGTEIMPGSAVKPRTAVPGRSSPRGDSLGIR